MYLGTEFFSDLVVSCHRYQMNPGNYREALIETRADEAEGADILMVRILCSVPYLFLSEHLSQW